MECDIAMLRTSATDHIPHDTLPILLRHIREFVPKHQGSIKCIFPECGNGFFEWNVMQLLQETHKLQISEVVMMDTYIQTHWVDIWTRIAKRADVRLVVLSSYVQLWDWARSQDPTARSNLVFYINGCFRFSEAHCPAPQTPELSRVAAVKFWRWCHSNALNNFTNFQYGNPVQPGMCDTWLEFAKLHDEKHQKDTKKEKMALCRGAQWWDHVIERTRYMLRNFIDHHQR